MKYIKILFIGFLLLMAFRCNKYGDVRYSFSVKNNAGHDILFYVAASGLQHKYPDTALETNKPGLRLVASGQSVSWGTGLKWETFFNELPTDTLSMYLFHADTIQKYDWANIRDNYRVLKRYDLSLENLKAMNFIVSYP